MNTPMLAEELANLQAQIQQAGKRHDVLAGELRVVDAELETFSADRQRFDALRDVCKALDKLGELKAGGLFWEGVAAAPQVAGHVEQAKVRVARFEGEIRGILEKQASLQGQINQSLDELNILDEEVREAYVRDERRQDEYVVEREISSVPHRAMIMPWTKETESERRFRKSLAVALSTFVVAGSLITVVKLAVPERPAVVVVPERLARMLRKEPPRSEPLSERRKDEKKPEKEQEKRPEKQQEDRPQAISPETEIARKKAESTGVLAFKDAFKGLVDENPAVRLGAEARLSKQWVVAAGQARASRSIISMQSTGGGTSGGIGNAGVSRTVGSGNGNRIGGVGFTRVESTVAGLAEGTRPMSSGPGPARTDEEIQIVFDRYKATLYRIYNAELRKDPTLRGKIIMLIAIEPGGEVSACSVQSNDLASPELVAQIVERVRKFNFGPKEDVPKTTILYPIDFLPGGNA